MSVEQKELSDFDEFMLAVENGNIKEMEAYFQKDFINKDNTYGQMAIHSAATCGNIDVFKYVMTKGGDAFMPDKYGRTPLHYAAAHGNLNIVKYLISQGANANTLDTGGCGPLHYAAVCPTGIDDGTVTNLVEVVQYLIVCGANVELKTIACRGRGCSNDNILCKSGDIDKVFHRDLYPYRGYVADNFLYHGMRPAHLACVSRNVDVLQCLLVSGCMMNVNEDDSRAQDDFESVPPGLDGCHKLLTRHKHKKTPLHFAAEKGHSEVVKYLIEKGAASDDKDDWTMTALHLAAEEGHLDVVQCLIVLGATIKAVDDHKTPLHFAAEKGHLRVVKYLIERLDAIDDKDIDGMTALHHAAAKGHLDVVRCLIDDGAAIDFKDDNGMTALHHAAAKGHLDVVKYLIERRDALIAEADPDMYYFELYFAECADIHSKDNDGMTVLHHAAGKGHLNVVNYLIDKDAPGLLITPNIDCKDDWKRTAMHCAAENGHLQIVQNLIQQGTDINAVDIDGMTCLHHAAEDGYLDLVRYLTEQGADTNRMDNFERTPLNLAVKYDHQDVINHLPAN